MKHIFAVCVVLCLPGLAEVAPTPGTQDLISLFNHADLVCGCSIKSVQLIGSEEVSSEAGYIRRKHFTSTLNARVLYKSGSIKSAVSELEFDDNDLSEGQTAILFLRSVGPSTYVLADRFIGATPFSHLPSNSDGGLDGLESDLLSMVHSSNRSDQLNAMKLLGGFIGIPAEKLDTLVPLTNSPDVEIALSAHAALLKRGHATDVARLRDYLRRNSPESPPASILAIGSELGLVNDRAAVPFLEDLSDSNLMSIRIGAMQALRRFREPAAARVIVRRLDDSSDYIRYVAIMTLAETFGQYGDYAPNMEIFDRNPGFYIGLWKSWWLQNSPDYQVHPAEK